MVQAPENSQNLNRYSYVLNNPLSYTDPSGYFFKGIGKFFKKYGRAIAAVGIAAVTSGIASGAIWSSLGVAGTSSAFGVVVAGGTLAGYVSTGSFKGALFGAFSAAAFYGIGEYFSGIEGTQGALSGFKGFIQSNYNLTKTIAHGLTGGILSELQGANFAHSFLSAGTTQAFAGVISIGDVNDFGDRTLRVAAAAAVGGTASELSGGKFTNGAVTGAFSRAFNDEVHAQRKLTSDSEKAQFETLQENVSRLRSAIGKLNDLVVDEQFENTEIIYDPDLELIGDHDPSKTFALGCHQCGTNGLNRIIVFPLAFTTLEPLSPGTIQLGYHGSFIDYGPDGLFQVLAHEVGHTLPSNYSIYKRFGPGFMVERNANNTLNRIIKAEHN